MHVKVSLSLDNLLTLACEVTYWEQVLFLVIGSFPFFYHSYNVVLNQALLTPIKVRCSNLVPWVLSKGYWPIGEVEPQPNTKGHQEGGDDLLKVEMIYLVLQRLYVPRFRTMLSTSVTCKVSCIWD